LRKESEAIGAEGASGTEPQVRPRDHAGMNQLLLVIILLILLGGGGFYWGGPMYGGSGLGLVLLICLIIFLMGGFRGRR
jgi:hypothetical protein